MCLKRSSLVLCIFIVFHIQQQTSFASSRPSTVDPNHKTLPFGASNQDVVGFEGKYHQELDIVIKRELKGGGGGGGGRGGGGGGRGGGRGGSSRGGGRSQQRTRGGAAVVPIHTTGSNHSSSGRNLRGTICTVGWLALSVLTGLFLVRKG